MQFNICQYINESKWISYYFYFKNVILWDTCHQMMTGQTHEIGGLLMLKQAKDHALLANEEESML